MKHRHHKIPRHAGGTDDPENIELLTVEEHAEAHRKLFEEHGRWQDKFAWTLLSRIEGNEDAIEQAYRRGLEEYLADPIRKEAGRLKAQMGLQKAYQDGLKPWNAGKNKLTDPRCLKISENVKRQAASGNFHSIGDYQRGRTFDEEHRSKLSAKAMKRQKKECEHCGKVCSPAMFARWHGDKCRD